VAYYSATDLIKKAERQWILTCKWMKSGSNLYVTHDLFCIPYLIYLRRFDASLKSRNSSWGVRDLETVVEVATENGLDFVEKISMPANNLSVFYRKHDWNARCRDKNFAKICVCFRLTLNLDLVDLSMACKIYFTLSLLCAKRRKLLRVKLGNESN